MTKSGRSLSLDLVSREGSSRSNRSQNHGKINVHAEECISSKTTTELILRCSDLEYKDLFSRSVGASRFLYLLHFGWPYGMTLVKILLA